MCRPGVEGALLTVSAVMRVERMGLSPRATPHQVPARLNIRRYTLSPSHNADEVDLPPADDADDDVARRECQDTKSTPDMLVKMSIRDGRGPI